MLHLQALLATVEGGHGPGHLYLLMSCQNQGRDLVSCDSGYFHLASAARSLCDRELQPEVDYDGKEQEVEGGHHQQVLLGMSTLVKI